MEYPKINQTRGAFSVACGVAVNIRAKPENVWNFLTGAKKFAHRNSTVSPIEGQIREGEQLCLRVPGTDRVFTPRVSNAVPRERMTWTGGFAPVFKSLRKFELRRCSDGSTDFAMDQRFSGLMLPLVKHALPISHRFSSATPRSETRGGAHPSINVRGRAAQL